MGTQTAFGSAQLAAGPSRFGGGNHNAGGLRPAPGSRVTSRVAFNTGTVVSSGTARQAPAFFGGVINGGNGGYGAGGAAGPGGGSGGGGIGCPCSWMLIDGVPVQRLTTGVQVPCIDPETGERSRHPILTFALMLKPCVMLTAEDGSIWAGSVETPFTQPDGEVVWAKDMDDKEVIVDDSDDSPCDWQKVKVTDIGLQQVARIELGGRTFACNAPGLSRVYSHNPIKG